MYIVLIIVVVLAIPALLVARLAVAKRREQRTGSPSEFTTPDPDAAGRSMPTPPAGEPHGGRPR
jgi:hypothetical protein